MLTTLATVVLWALAQGGPAWLEPCTEKAGAAISVQPHAVETFPSGEPRRVTWVLPADLLLVPDQPGQLPPRPALLVYPLFDPVAHGAHLDHVRVQLQPSFEIRVLCEVLYDRQLDRPNWLATSYETSLGVESDLPDPYPDVVMAAAFDVYRGFLRSGFGANSDNGYDGAVDFDGPGGWRETLMERPPAVLGQVVDRTVHPLFEDYFEGDGSRHFGMTGGVDLIPRWQGNFWEPPENPNPTAAYGLDLLVEAFALARGGAGRLSTIVVMEYVAE